MRRLFARFLLGALAVLMLLPVPAMAAGEQKVYVVRIDNWQEINAAMAQYARRVFAQAEADPNATAIAVVLDTPGGYVDDALEIKELLLLQSRLKTIAYVEGGAISAGALIATAAEMLYMHPGATIGAAEPRNAATNEPADYKALSVVAGTFESTAIARQRDPAVARAMVDKSTPIPGQKGELLTLTYQEAISRNYANGAAADLKEAIQKSLGTADFEVVDAPLTLSERVGRFLTKPWVAVLLLVGGVIAIGIEFLKPGVTLPGMIGVVLLGLFFLGNTLVGTAGWLELSLALIGILLLIIEAFIPGFGVFGAGGILAMGASIFMAVPSPELAWRYLAFTAVAFLVALFFVIQGVSKRGLGKSLTLGGTAQGWTAPRTELADLIGREGKTLTVLRPAGTAAFGEQKLDVVCEGEWVPAGSRVKIIRVEGTRVVVRAFEV